MMRSLYSGVSGLRVHQTKMDVIGNNIANVNTIGFKASSVQFTDILYQTTKSASGANSSTGTAGTNPQQIGLGASVAAVKQSITTAGGAQRTDNATDLMINGDSFFVVSRNGQNFFTKAGAFTTDNAGNLATEGGERVMGWKADANGNIVKSGVTNLDVMSEANRTASPEATTKAYVTGNIDPADADITAGNVAYNVDFYDTLGTKYTAVFKLSKDSSSTATDTVYAMKLDSITNADTKAALTFTSTPAAATVGKLTFDAVTGKLKAVTSATDKTINLKLTTSGTTPNTFPTSGLTIDFSTMTQYASTGKSNPQGFRGATDGSGAGRKLGKMSGISINDSGVVSAKYDNDTTKILGQIAVATFSNPAGLEAVGGNLFTTTANSGDFDGIGQEVKQGGGSFTSGALEMSNVDLSKEFTEMITTQRGFQANSKIITTSDTMLEELVNLKR
ncbi:flagellar hook protein FlgE [Anaeromicropila herbilytica]|uniref:Flagellar hook protein FlgE n=1 Tax=Anaeromicropila herbilytica TaxID=2785025 RepID=A0A7R7EMI2_9FIRM|nr:flagellar hook protein FlgE [Anaeromicropila herbilytica]BCN31527.1 flagellar hook protein FlgE [Anaeromicropila herbilytica]